jgi:hypothetical protein
MPPAVPSPKAVETQVVEALRSAWFRGGAARTSKWLHASIAAGARL